MPSTLTKLLLTLCALLALAACHGPTPGSLRHIAQAAHTSNAALPEILDTIALAPGSTSGKIASERFFELWSPSNFSGTARVGTWKLTFTSEWPPGYFDALLPAADYDIRGLQHRHVRDGRGIAIVGCRKNTKRDAIEALYPPELITRPVSTVFTVGPARTITIALQNPDRHPELAADFTAPLAKLLGEAAALSKLGFGGLTGSREALRRGAGLYLLEPYDPQKTPVIFVHGLLSTPLAWANVTNDLWGDPDFRRHHQIWHFHYPTSAPFLYSAKLFRQRLAAVRRQLDPHGVDPASAHLDIVAHSMGGLLTRTLITDSGEAVWNGVFRVPANSLRGAKQDLADVADILHWKARRDVRHVIFIAVPHRGSDLSHEIAGRVGTVITVLPESFTALYARLNRDNPEALQPPFRHALSHGTLTSIATLSTHHPLLPILNALPFAPWVTTHSIIGNRGRKGPLAKSSDGVVSYASSHLETTASELIVPAGHAAYKDPRTTAEILRILKAPPQR